jgi:soluble lytic murein transglycosylase
VVPLPRARPKLAGDTPTVLAYADAGDGAGPALAAAPAAAAATPARSAAPLLAAPTSTLSAADLATLKRAIEFARKGGLREASDLQQSVGDAVGRKLIEWAILRNDDGNIPLARYLAFIEANPGWPNVTQMRRRAEGVLWDDRHDAATIRAFFATHKPTTSKGRFALARALLLAGDRQGATHHAREAWRKDPLSRDLESRAFETFGALFTAADHKARMSWRLFAEDDDAALRAAQRLGGTDMAIAKARIAVNDKSSNAGALLDAVPAEGRSDAGYIFSRVQWLRRQDKIIEAAQLIQTAPRDPHALCDLDEWWIERRLLARKLLDLDEPKAAYVVARDAVPPPKENYRGEHQFTAGWIALRFLNDPATALKHFALVGEDTTHHMTLGRAGYWQGRALEAMGRQGEARAQYQAAARYSTAYYGQLAGARLGLRELTLHPPLDRSPERRASLANLEVVRAVEALYAIDQRDLVVPMMADLGDKAADAGALMMLGEVAKRNNDARGMLLVGKAALTRGLPLDHYAFPTIGIPKYQAIGPEVEPALVYSIARQESAFNPTVVSPAKAMGLMQVTPPTGRYLAKKYGATFAEKRLLTDPAYNVQFGAAALGGLLQDYRGSYILTFVGYNAGPGRVRDWVARYGDPRDPKVDAVDWVERIPFTETRNYVQRILENVQIYRARFGGGTRLMIEADLRRGAVSN